MAGKPMRKLYRDILAIFGLRPAPKPRPRCPRCGWVRAKDGCRVCAVIARAAHQPQEAASDV